VHATIRAHAERDEQRDRGRPPVEPNARDLHQRVGPAGIAQAIEHGLGFASRPAQADVTRPTAERAPEDDRAFLDRRRSADDLD
jgi:hypothetical protein